MTGGIGHLGTAPSSWTMQNCDTVLILGSTMPWIDFYPKPGQARGVQVDINPDRIGLRFPVEVGLTGDMKSTLDALQPLLAFSRPARHDVSFPPMTRSRPGRSWVLACNVLGDSLRHTLDTRGTKRNRPRAR